MTIHTSPKTTSMFVTLISAAAFMMTANVSVAKDNTLHMMTTPNEVFGTVDIEKGNIDRGIRRSLMETDSRTANRRVAAYSNLCIGYAKQGEYAVALEYCDKAVNEDRFAAITHVNRGAVHYMMGNYTRSVIDLQKARDLAPRTKEARNNLALAERSYAALQGNQSLAQDTQR